MTEAASAVGSAATKDTASAAKAAPVEAAISCCGGHGAPDHHGHHQPPADDGAKMLDPVCGMSVDPATSKHRFEHQGKTFHFCSAGCRGKFADDPAKYLDKKQPQAEMPAGTIYTCPMHPQIRQVGPGSCPICGMALEPEVASLDAPPNPELADMTRRFWIGLVLAAPAVVLEMGGHIVGGHDWVDPTLSNWIQLVFATPVVLWAGWPFFVRGWQSLVTRNLNMFTLIAMGTGVAYVYSVIGTLFPQSLSGDLPGAWRRGRSLFRGCQRHHRACTARAGAGTARARGDLGRDKSAVAACPQDCAPRR